MRFLRPNCRGCRNNNFGNIRKSLSRWKGLVGFDGSFCVFENYKYGIRALYILLCTYITKYGLDNVPAIISRYAPSSENNTRSYMAFCDERQPFPHVTTDGLSILYLMSSIMMYESMVEIEPKEILDILNEFGLCLTKKKKI